MQSADNAARHCCQHNRELLRLDCPRAQHVSGGHDFVSLFEIPEAALTDSIIGIKNEYGEGNAWYDLSPVVPFRA